ncbi:MAG: putative glycoside hydrolase, partial [Chloroflexota bacterium]
LRLDTIYNPGSCTEPPLRNQVADQVGDFCAISEQHPDWFLLDADGNRIFSQDNPEFVMMDPGNPGWRAFWLERARQNQEEYDWDGVFADNAEAGLGKRRLWGALPAAYPDDASYRSAITGFLEYLYTSYFQPEGRLLQANIIALDDGGAWLEYLQYLDGAMDESFAMGWSDDYLSVVQWEAEVSRAEETQALGKHVVLVSQGDRDDAERQTFAFASYLLASNGRASFRYADNEAYREVWLYSNYQLDLGAPLGPRYRAGSVWRRDFTQGSISVDPVNKTAAIEQP